MSVGVVCSSTSNGLEILVPLSIVIMFIIVYPALMLTLLSCYGEYHPPSKQKNRIDKIVDKATARKCIGCQIPLSKRGENNQNAQISKITKKLQMIIPLVD